MQQVGEIGMESDKQAVVLYLDLSNVKKDGFRVLALLIVLSRFLQPRQIASIHVSIPYNAIHFPT